MPKPLPPSDQMNIDTEISIATNRVNAIRLEVVAGYQELQGPDAYKLVHLKYLIDLILKDYHDKQIYMRY